VKEIPLSNGGLLGCPHWRATARAGNHDQSAASDTLGMTGDRYNPADPQSFRRMDGRVRDPSQRILPVLRTPYRVGCCILPDGPVELLRVLDGAQNWRDEG